MIIRYIYNVSCRKSISNLKSSYSKKNEINWKNFHGCKNILLCSFRGILTKYLGTLFNYKLIINYCEFSMAFINRTRVLVGIVMFKAHWRNNNKTFSHNNGKLLLLLNDTHREKQGFTQFSTGMAGWLLLTFFICLHNELSSIHSTITY